MAILKNTVITGTGSLTLPASPTARRTELNTTVQSFTTVGSTTWVCPAGVTSVEVLVVGGGGGGGSFNGGGGGAGGLIYRSSYSVNPSSSYTVTVGAGGAGDGRPGNGATGANGATGTNGGNSLFDTLTAVGGGYGGTYSVRTAGGAGGSGGGSWGTQSGGAGTANQGFAGGAGNNVGSNYNETSGGGGGAGGPGGDGQWQTMPGGGGPGLGFNITGTLQYYAGGGGAGANKEGGVSAGGIGGGGRGGTTSSTAGVAGTANTGGGGGGSAYTATPGASGTGGAGGSGIVILRYRATSDASNPIGIVRYNTDLSDTEVYDGAINQWVAQDQSKNYAGHNLLRYSEELNAAAVWTTGQASISSNADTAPDGTTTADKIVENTAGGVNHFVLQSFTAVANITYCFSFYAKASGRSSLRTAFSNYSSWVGGNGVEVSFNLSTETATAISSTPVETGIIPVGNGWYRCWAAGTATTGMSTNAVIYTENSPGNYVYLGDGSSGVLIWGTQVERDVRTPGPYNRTETAASPQPISLGGYRIHNYTTTGVCSFVPALTGTVEVLVVAGGGGAGTDVGGGGGGGGVVYNAAYPVIAGIRYKVTVGAGGGAGANPDRGGTGANGEDSQFGSIVAIGGGGGGYYYARMGYNGGSGGGQGGTGPNNSPVVAGTSFAGSGTVGQGHAGGNYRAGSIGGGGGGGAAGPGFDQWGYGADGGPGVGYDISGTMTFYGGGGGAGDSGGAAQIGHGGIGGGGDGDSRNLVTANLQVNGEPNTGGGGGADGGFSQSGSGGSGIVIVRYRHN
jgi:hypothetical protein